MDLVKLLEISNPKGLRAIINTVIEEHNQNVEDVRAVKQQIDNMVPDALADRYTKSEVNALLNDKVNKVEGKQLSTNDFTNLHKSKLEGLENYDDTELRTLIENFENYDDTELRDLINAEVATRELADTTLRNSINGKYSRPGTGIPKSDLASAVQTSLDKADTALQNIPDEYITESELNAKGYANAEDVTNIATNLTKNYETIANVDTKDATTLKSAKDYTDSTVKALVGSAPDTLDTLAELATAIKNDKNIVDTLEASIALKANKSDLDNYYVKESVDALVRGKYTKPATGIPKTDLASDVQNALNSIEANVQSDWTVTDITSDAYIKNKPSYLSQFANDVGYITGYTETDPTVPSHVKSITETNITNWNNKQAKLVSGTNIKTLHENSLLGSGDITLTAVQVGALPKTTKYGKTLEVSGRTVALKDQDGTLLSSITTQDTTYSNASTSAAGLMSAADKTKLDGIDTVIDTKLSKSGGTLTGPLKATGGDSATAGKIILDEANKGQITNSYTGTLFGFTNTSDLTLGHGNYNLVSRGKATRPTYNGKDLALLNDVPTLPTLATVATTGSYNDLSDRPTQITVDTKLSSTSTNPVENREIYNAINNVDSKATGALSNASNASITANTANENATSALSTASRAVSLVNAKAGLADNNIFTAENIFNGGISVNGLTKMHTGGILVSEDDKNLYGLGFSASGQNIYLYNYSKQEDTFWLYKDSNLVDFKHIPTVNGSSLVTKDKESTTYYVNNSVFGTVNGNNSFVTVLKSGMTCTLYINLRIKSNTAAGWSNYFVTNLPEKRFRPETYEPDWIMRQYFMAYTNDLFTLLITNEGDIKIATTGNSLGDWMHIMTTITYVTQE